MKRAKGRELVRLGDRSDEAPHALLWFAQLHKQDAGEARSSVAVVIGRMRNPRANRTIDRQFVGPHQRRAAPGSKRRTKHPYGRKRNRTCQVLVRTAGCASDSPAFIEGFSAGKRLRHVASRRHVTSQPYIAPDR
jgi:hypothetical protein